MKYLQFILFIFIFSCGENTSSIESYETPPNKYMWLDNYDSKNAIVNRIPPPEGFKRTQVEKGSFGDWLRHLPLKPAGSQVQLYNGELKPKQDTHEAVVDIDTGEKDLQQSAQAIIRLKGEYHFSKNELDKVAFNYTYRNTEVSFNNYAIGVKPIVVHEQERIYFYSEHGEPDYSYQNFKMYLDEVFANTGTISLDKQTIPTTGDILKVGDILVQGDSPGHAVIVVDLVENTSGDFRALLAQSHTPAQDIHLIKGWVSVPYKTNEGIQTPDWKFNLDHLKAL